jgi:uncharacterized protein YbjT (DUF2867 family)
MKNLTALILGDTSLVGKYCLHYLLQDSEYSLITVLSHRSLAFSHPKLQEYIIDFENLEDLRTVIQGNHMFCCSGTTTQQAGSKAGFRKVDYSYPLTLARIARENGTRQFILTSVLGANEKSKIFYNRSKGELEKSVKELDFPGTLIFRPFFLSGERSESQLGEKLGEIFLKGLRPLLQGKLRKYRAIHAQTLAVAMIEMSKVELRGIHIFESDQIQFFYNRLQKNIQAGIIPTILSGNE